MCLRDQGAGVLHMRPCLVVPVWLVHRGCEPRVRLPHRAVGLEEGGLQLIVEQRDCRLGDGPIASSRLTRNQASLVICVDARLGLFLAVRQ